jgi:uncharacterized protein (DUF1501 family)
MLRLESKRGVRTCDGVSRREFLRVGGLTLGLSLADLAQLQGTSTSPSVKDKACIQLFLTGGPSQLETWDPKPNAPESIRGPFRAVQTNVTGIRICEHFPLMAQRANRYAIIRSVYHDEPPIHETGQQLLQTGRFARDGIDWPHCGAVLDHLQPAPAAPTWMVLPAPIRHTGVRIGNGQGSGFLGTDHVPVIPCREEIDLARFDTSRAFFGAVDGAQCALEESGALDQAKPAEQTALATLFNPPVKRAFDLDAETTSVRARYGWNTFGQSCLLARRLVQQGVRLVTVNMFDTVFKNITWDCHANGSDLNSTLDDYGTRLCPMFDLAYTALLDDLADLGMLEQTLVVSMGEFGRTPRLNGSGGRDHWPGVWSVLLAGGGVRGGQVIGSSDAHAEAPRDRPVHASQIAATVYHSLGIDPAARLSADGRSFRVIESEPVVELF